MVTNRNRPLYVCMYYPFMLIFHCGILLYFLHLTSQKESQLVLVTDDCIPPQNTSLQDSSIMSSHLLFCVCSFFAKAAAQLASRLLWAGRQSGDRQAEPMRSSRTEGAQCRNSLVTATCLLLLPSSMASMTSSGLHTKRSVHPWGHKHITRIRCVSLWTPLQRDI